MIRLIQRRLIIPRGDTGSFTIPTLTTAEENDIAIFTIFDEMTHKKIFQKQIKPENNVLNITFTHSDTVNLKVGKYVWDIKFYKNPKFVDEELVDGEEINSYYAGFTLPVCEIRETADNFFLTSDNSQDFLNPEEINFLLTTINTATNIAKEVEEKSKHYPKIIENFWYFWDSNENKYINSGMKAQGDTGNGIASVSFGENSSMIFNFTDGTSYITPSLQGEKGTTFIPSINDKGVISWSNNGGENNPQEINLVTAVIEALPSAVGVDF